MRALLRLGRFLKPYRLWALLAPLSMVGEVTLDLMQPRLLQRIVDQGIARHDLTLVLHTGLLMVCFALMGVVAGSSCTYFTVKAGQCFGADLRRELFAKVQSLSFGNLDTLESGALITRLTNDVTQVQEVVMMVLRIMVRAPLLLVGSLVMALLTSTRLSLIFIPLMPFVLGVFVWVVRRTYPLFSTVQGRLDRLNTVMQENLSGVRVVKAFARARYEEGRFGEASDSLMDTSITAARLGAVTMPMMMVALNVGVVATLWFGGRMVTGGALHPGQVIAFCSYLTETLMSLMFTSMLLMNLARAAASGGRIEEVLTAEPLIEDAAQPARPERLDGRVTFEDVTFGYGQDGSEPALQGVSFAAEPGQTVAILGATGAGKSTLVNLVPRFYEVTGGRITLGGTDIRDLPQDALRGAVAVALQEPILFSGSIRDNIRYGRPEATDDEVLAAARAAQADEFIGQLPEGYDTNLGQRGVNLSGGQKQRLAIARALLVRPSVLILDDSTSAVDVRTESAIQQALSKEHPGQTRLVVAQRVSAAIGADQILVLDDGRLVARGTHDELMRSSPVYREIYESQRDSGMVADGLV
ncbi:MAG TPA: ABC transporter ATP-binding protein [Armatimonadota bacterium]|jgi:ATP-binding cassette subfamily B protein